MKTATKPATKILAKTTKAAMRGAEHLVNYAVIATGGKQYRVMAGDVIRVEKLTQPAGSMVEFDKVLLVNKSGKTEIGAPYVNGVKVKAEIVSQGHLPTIIIFKKNRRHNYRRRNGVRPLVSLVRITAIAE